MILLGSNAHRSCVVVRPCGSLPKLAAFAVSLPAIKKPQPLPGLFVLRPLLRRLSLGFLIYDRLGQIGKRLIRVLFLIERLA
jgi:hypothetical protein